MKQQDTQGLYQAIYAGSAVALLTTLLPALLPRGGPSNQELGALALIALAGLPLASRGRGSIWSGALLGALFWATSLVAGSLAGGLGASGMGVGPGQLARNTVWYALRGLIGGLAASAVACRMSHARGALAGGLVFALAQLNIPSIVFASSPGVLAWRAPGLVLGVAGATIMIERGRWPGLGFLAAGTALAGASPLVGGVELMPRLLGGLIALGVVLVAGAYRPSVQGPRGFSGPGTYGALAYVIVLLLPLLLAATGVRVVVVTSGSMEPSLGIGDLAVVVPGRPEPGSVVLYRHGGGLVIHRVVEDRGAYLVTRGDANSGRDPWDVGRESVVGVMRLRVPWVGRPLLWLRAALGGL